MSASFASFCPLESIDVPLFCAQNSDLPDVSRTERNSNITEMVAAAAVRSPEAPAIVAADSVLTFAELNQRANRLANYLVSLGVGAETIVGLCLDRSPEFATCALAVLKAGGAYLPMDPAYPVERLGFTLNDARPCVLITTSSQSAKLTDGGWQVINIDEAEVIESFSSSDPGMAIDPNQLAYVIYTSGSTGQPKGVEITHESLMNLVTWHQREFDVTPQDKASHLASVGFDAAVWEVWPYLAAGASVHLPDQDTRLSPELLRDWLVASEITVSFLPTALAEQVMTLAWPDTTALRYLLTGADTLHRHPIGSLPFELVNNYGPTECTVVATSGRVKVAAGATERPTIGRPIANISIHLLDENLEPVPFCTPGELYIGGAGVARGYLNRPDLNAERFVRDPFDERPGARLYKTGDLARYEPDGQIAYLGRVDEQIKILGYRIEPVEIEAAISRHPAIESSVVVACGSACEEKRLTAYLVMRNGSTPAAAELRGFLQESLPAYMVPTVFVKLPVLPLTSNGKIDRTALPEPNRENILRDEAFAAPGTPTEERLAKVMSSMLNLKEVSVNDNFFLLGGHSLLGAQLIAKFRGAFGVDLALRTLFEAPTISALSAEIERLIFERVAAMSEDEAQRLLA